MWLTGPVAPRHVGSSQTRARTRVPCIGRQTLNHCATREAHYLPIFLIDKTRGAIQASSGQWWGSRSCSGYNTGLAYEAPSPSGRPCPKALSLLPGRQGSWPRVTRLPALVHTAWKQWRWEASVVFRGSSSLDCRLSLGTSWLCGLGQIP